MNVRGIGSGTGTSAFDQNVSIFNDGIYAGRSRQFVAPFFDVDHIEVLRGPQGAVVGKNTSAGAVIVTSALPTKDLTARVSGEYDFTLQRPQITGVISGPLSDNWGFRLAARYEETFKGYLQNLARDRREPEPKVGILRGVLRYDDGQADATIKAEYAERRVYGNYVQGYIPGDPRFPLDYVKEADGGLAEFDNIRTLNYSANVNVPLGDWTVTSTTGYSSYHAAYGLDPDGYAAPLVTAVIAEQYEQYSQELRLTSPSGRRFEYIAGLYVQGYRHAAQRLAIPFFVLPGSSLTQFVQRDFAASAYGELVWNPHPEVAIKLDGRYTYERKTADYSQTTGVNPTPNALPTVAFPSKLDDGIFDPAIVGQWRASDDVMVFASVARGSKGSAFQGDVSGAQRATYVVGPERSTSYEVGVKLRLFNSRARLGLSLYSTTYDDLQLAEIDPNSTTSIVFVVRNAGKARSQGVEVDGDWRINEWLRLSGGGAYNDAKFLQYTTGECAVGQIPDGSRPGSCNYNGVSLAFAPKWSGNISLDARYPLGPVTLVGSISIQAQSQMRTINTNDPFGLQPGFAKTDLRAGVAANDGDWELALVVRNATDELTRSWTTIAPPSVSVGGLSSTYRLVKVDLPRTVALQFKYDF